MNKGYHSLGNGDKGYLIEKLPQSIYSEVEDVVCKIQNNFSTATPYNEYLVGHIDKEYKSLLKPQSTLYIKSLAEKFHNFNPQYLNNFRPFFLNDNLPPLTYKGDIWVNYQEKYEYNPTHTHTGIFSFVIWYQIPYYFEDEYKVGPKIKGDKSNCLNGKFQFQYPFNNTIYSETLPIDKTMEGHIAIFPSSLNHVVHPFYSSNNYRITLSGNLYLK